MSNLTKKKTLADVSEQRDLTYEFRDGRVVVHRWGTYEDGVLKGQPKKTFVASFDNEGQARAAYPDAQPSHPLIQPQNTFDHLPDDGDY